MMSRLSKSASRVADRLRKRGPKGRFTVEPGRQIYRDGKPFIGVTREGSDSYPADIDDVTHIIADCLNKKRI